MRPYRHGSAAVITVVMTFLVGISFAACGDLERETADGNQPAAEQSTVAPQPTNTTTDETAENQSCDHQSERAQVSEDTEVHIDDAILEKADREGTVSVIVTLDITFTPEGELETQREIDDQRERIRAAQDKLMESLEGFNAEETTRYERLRQIVLTVDRAALDELARSPLVKSVEENVLDAPTT